MLVEPRELRDVTTSQAFGKRRFPTQEDYVVALAAAFGGARALADPVAAATVARHWHTTGQTGCLFARMLGRQATPSEWPTLVVDDASSPQQAAAIDETLRAGFESPEVQLVSVVMPAADSISALKAAAVALDERTMVTFFEDRSLGAHVRVAGRVGIGEGVLAWIMAFGPFEEWPATRRGPVVEFVIRTKPKRDGLFEKLNQDQGLAHLADIDLGLPTSKVSRMFDGTVSATKDVLGAGPDELSAAKTTFSFPVEAWEAAGGQNLRLGSLAAEPDYPPAR